MESVTAHKYAASGPETRSTKTGWMRHLSQDPVTPQLTRDDSLREIIRDREELAWRQLNERSGLLESATVASALLSGFGTQALVDLQFNKPTLVTDHLNWIMSATTTLLVAVHIVALSLGTLALPYLQVPTRIGVAALTAPHTALRRAVELVWFLAFVLGMFFFLTEVAILSWVKYWDYSQGAAIAGCAVALTGLVGLSLFILHFHRLLAIHEDENVTWRVQELEQIRDRLVTDISLHHMG